MVLMRGILKKGKTWLNGLVLLFLFVAPVAADICNPISGTGFCIVDAETEFTYNEIPFDVTILSIGLPATLLYARQGETDTFPMNGYTATKIHFIDHAESVTLYSDGFKAGEIVVYYEDGTSSDPVELIVGENIADWAYDRPEVQSHLSHTKITPAYTYPSHNTSAYTYDAHLFYSSIDTEQKPIDRIELKNIATGSIVKLGIDSITLDSGSAQTLVPLCPAGTPFDHTVYPQNTPQSDPMVFQCYWDGTGQVYLSGDQSSLTGIYADDEYTLTVQPSGSSFSSTTDGPSHHPVIELTSGMTPGVNSFTLVVQNGGLSMWYALYPTASVSQTPYIVQVTDIPTLIHADFEADPVSGKTPLTVQFTDKSTSDSSTIIAWCWKFRETDVCDSTEQNPQYVYTNPGKYPVSLDVTDQGGNSDGIKKEEYITVLNAGSLKTYSTTDTVDLPGIEGQGYQTVHAVEKRLENLGWTPVMTLHDPDVTKESMGVNGDVPENNLNHATLHWHTGHGVDGGGLFLRTNGYLMTDEVAGKWGYQNKWIVLYSCQALKTDEWENAMKGTHGILGFYTDSYVRPSFAEKFFDYATINKKTVYKSFRAACVDEFKDKGIPINTLPDGKPDFKGPAKTLMGKVIFANEEQFLNDHLPGAGSIMPDAVAKDDKVSLPFPCTNGEYE